MDSYRIRFNVLTDAYSKSLSESAIDHLRFEIVPCNLCGGHDDRLLFQKNSFNIVKCKHCGLVYVNPRLMSSEIAKEYDNGYYINGSYADYLSERPGFERTFERRLEKIGKLVEPGRILDIGCAFGFFLTVAEKRGWEAYGVDLSQAACQYAVEQLGMSVICGTVAQSGFADSFFDAVVMNDTFEHLSDPSAELAEARRVLRPGGHLFLVTQDVSSLIVRLLGRHWAQYKPREHLYYFNRRTLRQILEKAGFEVLKIEGEGLVCTLDFLVGKLRNLWQPAGQALGLLIGRLGLGHVLVPVWPGYEVMVYAQKGEER